MKPITIYQIYLTVAQIESKTLAADEKFTNLSEIKTNDNNYHQEVCNWISSEYEVLETYKNALKFLKSNINFFYQTNCQESTNELITNNNDVDDNFLNRLYFSLDSDKNQRQLKFHQAQMRQISFDNAKLKSLLMEEQMLTDNKAKKTWLKELTLLVEKNSWIKNSTVEDEPFFKMETKELFEYLVKKWNYDKNQKWADIWNAIDNLKNHKAPYKNEYERHIRTVYKYTGKFQYDKPKKDGNRDKQNLLELIKEFSEK